MSWRLVVLETYESRVQAELARGLLEGAGIAAVVSADDCGGMRPELRLNMGVRLLVAEGDLLAAQHVLETRSQDLDG
jgi:hypothetical protein